jgi:spermidine synthase
MKDTFIYLAVVVSGASVLAVEILGTRIIGPFYGVSLYLWSALIGVALAALSVGYAVGGRLADRGPRLDRFSLLLGLAGLWVVAIPWLRFPVLSATEALGLRTAVLITATALFFPPLVLLGMVSPYAIRLKTASVETVGRTAGNLYAISTIAAVVAAIGTGFFLIPNLGVSLLTFAIGMLLILTALAGLAVARRGKAAVVPVALLLLASAGAPAIAPQQRPDPDAGLLALEHSAYAELRVVELDGLRYMLIDGGTHTIVDAWTMETRFEYVDVVDIAKSFYEAPGRLLLIGLGGGSVVKSYARDGWQVDAVEIDPAVTRLAYSHFGLLPDEATIHHQDGRRFLIDRDQTYDLIILDAFGSSSVPFHLITREAFGLVRSRLAPGGVVVLNIEAVGWRDVIVRSVSATLGTQFAEVLVLPIAEPPSELGNVVLMAADRPLELREPLPVPEYRFSREYNRAHAWDNRFAAEADGAPVLTDERNPVDVWSERINLVARARMHEHFSTHGVSW